MPSARGEYKRLSDALVEIGLVDRAQLTRVAQRPGAQNRLLRAVVDAGLVDEDRLVRALSSALRMEAVTPSTMKIHERVLGLLPAALALRRGALPVAIKRSNQIDYLYVALADPLDADTIEEVKKATGCEVSALLAPPSQLEAALDRYYRGAGGAAPVAADKSASPPPRPPRVSMAGQSPIPPASSGVEVRPVTPPPRPEEPKPAEELKAPGEIPEETTAETAGGYGLADPDAFELEAPRLPKKSDEDLGPPELRAAFERAGLSLDAPVDDNRTVLDSEVPEEEIDLLSDPQIPSSSVLSTAISRNEPSREDPITDYARLDEAGVQKVDLGKSQIARLLELPVDVDAAPSPFDDLRGVKLKAGLERTGIIPALDFDREPFDPPPPDGAELPEARHVVGVGDIPVAPSFRMRSEPPPDALVKESRSHHQRGMGGSAAAPLSTPPPRKVEEEEPEPSELPESVRQALEPNWGDLTARPSNPSPSRPAPKPPARSSSSVERAAPAARPAAPRAPSKPPEAKSTPETRPSRPVEPEPRRLFDEPEPPATSGSEPGLRAPPAPPPAPRPEPTIESKPRIDLAPTLELKPMRAPPIDPTPRRSEPPTKVFAEEPKTGEARKPPRLPEAPESRRTDVPVAAPEPPRTRPPEPKREITSDMPTVRPGPAVAPTSWGPEGAADDLGPEEEPTNPRIRAAELEAKAKKAELPTPESQALVDALIRGDSLNSADRAQLVLALGRLLIQKRIITAIELAGLLDEG